MANGHYAYFSHFKKEYQFKYNLFVLNDFLPEKHYNNLIDAKEIYDTYPNKKELSKIEEKFFLLKTQEKCPLETQGFF